MLITIEKPINISENYFGSPKKSFIIVVGTINNKYHIPAYIDFFCLYLDCSLKKFDLDFDVFFTKLFEAFFVLSIHIDNALNRHSYIKPRHFYAISLADLQSIDEKPFFKKIKYYQRILFRDSEYFLEKIDKKDFSQNLIDIFFQYKQQKYSLNSVNFTFDKVDFIYLIKTNKTITREGIIAMALFSANEDYIYLENITYNQEFKKYSPGYVLLYELIRLSKQLPFRKIYLGKGDYEYKKIFSNENFYTYSDYVVRGNLKILKTLNKVMLRIRKKSIQFRALIN